MNDPALIMIITIIAVGSTVALILIFALIHYIVKINKKNLISETPDEFDDKFEDSNSISKNTEVRNYPHKKTIELDSYFLISLLIFVALLLICISDIIELNDTVKALDALGLSISTTVYKFIAVLFSKIVLSVMSIFIIYKIKTIKANKAN